MDLDDTWQVGLRPEKTKPCTFPAKLRYGFRRERKKWVTEALFFCDVNHAPLVPLSFYRFPPNFPRTHVQVVACDTWFHIPEKFPVRGRTSRKTICFRVLYGTGTLFVTRLQVTGNVLRRLHCFYPLVDIPQICPT